MNNESKMNSRELLEKVYEELRLLAAKKMRHETPDQTIDATGLVHEAWMRIKKDDTTSGQWANEAHFFSAAAQAMRRILIENARHKNSLKRGGNLQRSEFLNIQISERNSKRVLEIHDALEKLEVDHAEKAKLVELKYFGGLTQKEAADVLGISVSTADRHWAFARAWLHAEIDDENQKNQPNDE